MSAFFLFSFQLFDVNNQTQAKWESERLCRTRHSTVLSIRERKQRIKKNVSHLYDVVIKQQPEAVALDDGDVVSAVGTTAETDDRWDTLRRQQLKGIALVAECGLMVQFNSQGRIETWMNKQTITAINPSLFSVKSLIKRRLGWSLKWKHFTVVSVIFAAFVFVVYPHGKSPPRILH